MRKYVFPFVSLLMVLVVVSSVQTINAVGVEISKNAGEVKKPEELSGVITLKQALSFTLLHNPELVAFSWHMRATEAGILQADLFPNPQIELESQGVGEKSSQAPLTPTDTLKFSQLIELGGKRTKRLQLAQAEQSLSVWDYEIKWLEALTETNKTYIDVLAAQERLKLTNELIGLAEQVLTAVSQQVAAGKVSPLEEIKAKAGLAGVKIELQQAKSNLTAYRRRLAAGWGDNKAGFEKVDGQLDVISPIPLAEQIAALIERNPDIARWAAEITKRRAALKLEEANRVVDLTVSAGIQSVRVENDTAFLVGMSIPIPAFNRNQGNILEAQYRLLQAEDEQRAAQIRVQTALAEAYQGLSFSFSQATVLKDEILPAAQRVFDAVQEGYRQGKFGLLEVLDAQRTLFAAKRQYNEALSGYHKAVVDIERLIGDKLESLQN